MKKETNIVLAADHAGYELKEAVKRQLAEQGYSITDVGADKYSEEDDYPEFMRKAAEIVCKDLNEQTVAIMFGGSGQGEAIVANRFPGVRAAVWYGTNFDVVKLSREHNNANVLSIGARFVTEQQAMKGIELWLSTPFPETEKHKRRIVAIDNFE